MAIKEENMIKEESTNREENALKENNTIKEEIVKIISSGSNYHLNRFMAAIAENYHLDYSSELRHLESEIAVVKQYQEKFSAKLNKELATLHKLKNKLKLLKKPLLKPNISKREKTNLKKELFTNEEQLKLVLTEIESLKKMHSLLDEMSADYKDELNKIKRGINRSAITK